MWWMTQVQLVKWVMLWDVVGSVHKMGNAVGCHGFCA